VGVALLVSRLLLATVFAVSGVAKASDFSGTRRAVTDFGAPERGSLPVALLLLMTELAIAVTLVPTSTAHLAGVGAAALLVAFIAVTTLAIFRGRAPDCHCFGNLHNAPVGWRTVARNVAFLALALFIAIAGWGEGGPSATAWVGRLSAIALVGLGVAVVVVAAQAWFSFQLLRHYGRLLIRVQQLEEAQSELASPGPRPGSTAPSFSLTNAEGGRTALSQILGAGKPVVLVFSDPLCGPCRALLPEVGAYAKAYEAHLQFVVVGRGSAEANFEAAGPDLAMLLLVDDEDASTWSTYGARGAPAAIVIGPDGRVLLPTVMGATAISQMIYQAVISLPASLEPVPIGAVHGGVDV
jgi:thiol-disulfide isomerase/thioredoxin